MQNISCSLTFIFICRGAFEILRIGRLPEIVEGIQAHLSNFASPKVHEVACRFPCNIQLEEVPRVSLWPLQFQETGPKEDNIGLYFFAKDAERSGLQKFSIYF